MRHKERPHIRSILPSKSWDPLANAMAMVWFCGGQARLLTTFLVLLIVTVHEHVALQTTQYRGQQEAPRKTREHRIS
jgi:hypothetical protein